MRTSPALAASLVLALAAQAPAADPAPREELAKGKLAAELGRRDEARQILSSLAYRPGVPEDVACEALLRYASITWQQDRRQGAELLRSVADKCSDDRESMRLLAELVTGVAQDPATWRGRGEDFVLTFVDGPAGLEPKLVYVAAEERDPFQEARSAPGRQSAWRGDPMSIDVTDADLVDLLRLFHEVSGLDFIVDPEVRGTVTVTASEMPWDQLFFHVLEARHLGISTAGQIVRIAPLSKLAAERFLGSSSQLAEQRATAATVEKLTAIASRFKASKGHWPVSRTVADAGAVRELLEAAAGEPLPGADAWGRPLRYWSDGAVMRVASGGTDAVLAHPELVGYAPGVARRPEDDLLWQDGRALILLASEDTATRSTSPAPQSLWALCLALLQYERDNGALPVLPRPVPAATLRPLLGAAAAGLATSDEWGNPIMITSDGHGVDVEVTGRDASGKDVSARLHIAAGTRVIGAP